MANIHIAWYDATLKKKEKSKEDVCKLILIDISLTENNQLFIICYLLCEK